MKSLLVIISLLMLTSCSTIFPRPKQIVPPVKSYQEKQEDKTYMCLKEIMDKMAFNGMKTNLEDITSACSKIYME